MYVSGGRYIHTSVWGLVRGMYGEVCMAVDLRLGVGVRYVW